MDDVIRPIRAFGFVLIAFGVFGSAFFLFLTTPAPFFSPSSPDIYERVLFYFTIAVNIIYLLTGLGVVFLKKWGYILFKLFLYLLFLAFPIGTIISYVTLQYMRRHQVKRCFGFAGQEESPKAKPLAFSTKMIILLLVIGSVALYL
ncbi:MAG: hypothetical protein ACE5JU_08035 [Candidatus Binatia bacterium]